MGKKRKVHLRRDWVSCCGKWLWDYAKFPHPNRTLPPTQDDITLLITDEWEKATCRVCERAWQGSSTNMRLWRNSIR